MAIFNFLHQCAIHTLMVRSVFAKFFFVIAFSFCLHSTPEVIKEKLLPAIEAKNIADKRYLCFQHKSASTMCVFFFQHKWYLVWDCSEELPTQPLPTNRDLPPSMLNVEYATEVKTSHNCVVLKFDVFTDMVPIVTHTKNGWAIYAMPDYLSNDIPIPNQLIFDQQKQGNFRILSAQRTIPVTLTFPDGDELYVLPTPQADAGLDMHESDCLSILETIQGACMIKRSDQMVMETQGNDLSFTPTKDPPMHSEMYIRRLGDEQPKETFLRKGSIEPALMRDIVKEHSAHQKQLSDYTLLKLRQSWLEITIGEGANALNTLSLLFTKNSAIANHRYFLFLKGCALCLSGQYLESVKVFKTLPKNVETKLWLNIALSQLNEKVWFDDNLIAILRAYPTNLSNQLITIVIPYLFETEQVNLFKKVMSEIPPQSGSAKAIGEFYLAKQNFMREDTDFGYQELLKIAKEGYKQALPIEFQVEARFITYMFKNGSNPPQELIKELSTMRTQARGSDIEIKIAMKLIEELEKVKNFVEVINILQDLEKRFTDKERHFGFTQKLEDYVFKFFTEDNSEISQLKYVSLFNKYRKQLASHPEFEVIALKTAEKLEQLNLIDQAADLILDINRHNPDNPKKFKYLLKAAELYWKDSQYDKVINILQDLYPQADEKEKPELGFMLANAYSGKKEYQTAITYLSEFSSKTHKRAVADIYIQQEDYQKIIESLKDYISLLTDRDDDSMREKAILQLAATYRILSDRNELKKLYTEASEFMKDRDSYKAFAAFCRPHATELQTAQEVKDYIADGQALNELISNAQKVLFENDETTTTLTSNSLN